MLRNRFLIHWIKAFNMNGRRLVILLLIYLVSFIGIPTVFSDLNNVAAIELRSCSYANRQHTTLDITCNRYENISYEIDSILAVNITNSRNMVLEGVVKWINGQFSPHFLFNWWRLYVPLILYSWFEIGSFILFISHRNICTLHSLRVWYWAI